jgi:RNA polymerase sigma-70 factor (ECF subfamily)
MATEPTENPSSQNWKECFRELAPRLILYARQFVESIADAEDVVQMAFVRWWQRHPDGDRNHVPLLYAAVRSISLDLRRKDMRRILREAKSDVAVSGEDHPFFDPAFEQQESAKIVSDALQYLPDEQREVVTLHLWGGLTFAQIAGMTGVSINTVAGRYRYALASLHRRLEPHRSDLGEAAVAPAT